MMNRFDIPEALRVSKGAPAIAKRKAKMNRRFHENADWPLWQNG